MSVSHLKIFVRRLERFRAKTQRILVSLRLGTQPMENPYFLCVVARNNAERLMIRLLLFAVAAVLF
ncbi:MAG: hypothetical protein LBQ50_11600 [Planctomycetaceae bacterium]|jgi:hypothetical protein|nr:hypothetical protein [Planctomycetaceae bacterium]